MATRDPTPFSPTLTVLLLALGMGCGGKGAGTSPAGSSSSGPATGGSSPSMAAGAALPTGGGSAGPTALQAPDPWKDVLQVARKELPAAEAARVEALLEARTLDRVAEAGAIRAAHYALITVCSMYPGLAFDTRFVRATLLEVLRQDYVRTARAKGVAESKVVLKHAFRNTLIPVITRLSGVIPALISGSVILEVIFNWPGLGRLFYEAVQARDYPLMMAGLVVSSSLVLLGILLADLAYGWADPRISYE